MSSARGQANHRLYLARIVLSAWEKALAEEDVSGAVLNQAYLPAVREHLTEAYGWFMLEIARPEPLPKTIPQSVQELPEVIQGKALAGEIRELAQLEESAWLGELLTAQPGEAVKTSSQNLLSGAAEGANMSQMRGWADQLQKLFDRMSDSLDEC